MAVTAISADGSFSHSLLCCFVATIQLAVEPLSSLGPEDKMSTEAASTEPEKAVEAAGEPEKVR